MEFITAVASTAASTVVIDGGSGPAPVAYTVKLDSALCNQGKKQDFLYVGRGLVEGKGECEIGAVFDGHSEVSGSKRHFIEYVRRAPLDTLLVQARPINALVSYFKQFEQNYDFSTGSTCTVVRLFPDIRRIEWWSVGDSNVCIFKQGVLLASSPHHTPHNVDELRRLNDQFGVQNCHPTNWQKPEVINSTDITLGWGYYMSFPPKDPKNPRNYLRMALTQSLGHHDHTGYTRDEFGELGEHGSVEYEACDDIKVVLCSDGVTDVLQQSPRLRLLSEPLDKVPEDWQWLGAEGSTATVIMQEAVRRWKQEWNYLLDGYKPVIHQFEDGEGDDVSVVTMFVKGDPSVPSRFFG